MPAAQPVSGLVNTYAPPANVLLPEVNCGAPTMTVSPSTATECPNHAFVAPSDAVSLAVNAALPLVSSVSQSAQPLPGLVKM